MGQDRQTEGVTGSHQNCTRGEAREGAAQKGTGQEREGGWGGTSFSTSPDGRLAAFDAATSEAQSVGCKGTPGVVQSAALFCF